MHATLRLLRPALAVLALGLVGRAAAQSGSAGSPFMPPASVAATAAAAGETLEFGGINVMGTKTLVNVFDKATKKGRWIEVGGTDGAYTVLAYDPRREQIVVKSGDVQKTLTLRKGTGPARSPGPAPVAIMPAASGFATPDNALIQKIQPAPPPAADPATLGPVANANPSSATPPVEAAPAKPEAPAKPLTVARQEEEARMLVSDLLEIGMAQRKAYEEAQKKAAEGNTAAPAATPATPAPGG